DSRPGRIWSFREGLRLLIEALRDRLGGRLVTGVGVRRVARAEGGRPGWVVAAEGRDRWQADAVVLACPAYRQAGRAARPDRARAELVGGIAYNRVAVVALGYRREDVPGTLDGFGYIAPQRLRRDVLGVQWCSSIFPDRAPSGAVLLRAMCGGWHRADVAGWDEPRLLEAVPADLGRAMHVPAEPVSPPLIPSRGAPHAPRPTRPPPSGPPGSSPSPPAPPGCSWPETPTTASPLPIAPSGANGWPSACGSPSPPRAAGEVGPRPAARRIFRILSTN